MNEKVNENSWIPLMVVACATFICGFRLFGYINLGNYCYCKLFVW